jgi:hypothetical protein
VRRAGWHRVRKLLCFYYPHDVTTAPSAIVPGAQYLSTLTDEQRENDGTFLNVPAGSFVLLHYSMWHRGSMETKGERRVMLKLLFDRTEQPSSIGPSWDHRQTPRWSEDTLRERPWVPALFNWLAGAAPPRVRMAAGDAEPLIRMLTHSGLVHASSQDQLGPQQNNLTTEFHRVDPWIVS